MSRFDERAKDWDKKNVSLEKSEACIKHLKNIPIKGKEITPLKNGNKLEIKRLSKNNFEVRIEDNFRSALAPVIICKIITLKHIFSASDFKGR